MAKKSFKETMVGKLRKRLAAIDGKMAGYQDLVEERNELLKAIAVFETPGAPGPAVQASPGPNGDSPGATSPEGLRVWERLPKLFTLEDLTPMLNNQREIAYQFVAAWKRSNKIETSGRGCYQKK